MTTTVTQDRIARAKDALMYALRSAENELNKKDCEKLDKLVGEVEALQNKIKKSDKKN